MFVLLLNHTHAGVMELVDVPDSKSGEDHTSCRFDPDLRQIKQDTKRYPVLFCPNLAKNILHKLYPFMQVYSNNNASHINFQGTTRTLRRNYFETLGEITDVFEKHPKSDGIAGNLPFSWVKNIIHLSKEEKTPIFRGLYKLLRESFSTSNTQNPAEISRNFTTFLRQHKIIPPENQIIVKKRNLDGKVLKGAYTISERGKEKTLEPLFVKQFVENSKKIEVDQEGLLPELAIGLHLGKVLHDEHIIKPFFGDTKGGFMVTPYHRTPQNVKIPPKLDKIDAFDYYAKQAYFAKLRKITGDDTDIELLLNSKDFTHKDLHDENVLITRDKKGRLIVKLIDLGGIVNQFLDLFAR